MNISILSPENRLLTSVEAAEVLRIQPQTLAQWRSTNRYPLRFVRVGRRIFYRLADIERFIAFGPSL